MCFDRYEDDLLDCVVETDCEEENGISAASDLASPCKGSFEERWEGLQGHFRRFQKSSHLKKIEPFLSNPTTLSSRTMLVLRALRQRRR
jgi:hypothetical protein